MSSDMYCSSILSRDPQLDANFSMIFFAILFYLALPTFRVFD